jgi:hypothetical protein
MSDMAISRQLPEPSECPQYVVRLVCCQGCRTIVRIGV